MMPTEASGLVTEFFISMIYVLGANAKVNCINEKEKGNAEHYCPTKPPSQMNMIYAIASTENFNFLKS